MAFLPVLHQAATVASAAGVLYAASVAFAVAVSLLAPDRKIGRSVGRRQRNPGR
jgi:hypothetical protein